MTDGTMMTDRAAAVGSAGDGGDRRPPRPWGSLGDGPPVVLMAWHAVLVLTSGSRIAPVLARHRPGVFFLRQCRAMAARSRRAARAATSRWAQNGNLRRTARPLGLSHPDVVAHDFGGATALRAHLLDGCDYRSLKPHRSGGASARGGRRWSATSATTRPPSPKLPGYMHRANSAGLPAFGARPADRRRRPRPLYRALLGEEGQRAFYRQIAVMDQRFTDDVQGPLRRDPAVPEPDPVWARRRLDSESTAAAELAGSGTWAPASSRVAGARSNLMQEDAPEAIIGALVGLPAGAGRGVDPLTVPEPPTGGLPAEPNLCFATQSNRPTILSFCVGGIAD